MNENNPLTIREATSEDLPAVLRLYNQVDGDEDMSIDVQAAEAIFAKIASYPDYKVYVAELKNEIIGTFTLLIMDNMTHGGSTSGVIESVVVTKALQGQGIGKQMMEYAIERCQEKNCYKATLSSNMKRVDAHKFYERIGFKSHGRSFLTELKDTD